jgi:hypothetical protein
MKKISTPALSKILTLSSKELFNRLDELLMALLIVLDGLAGFVGSESNNSP